MGFSALDGLMMGTRCGSLDPGVLLYLIDSRRWAPASLSRAALPASRASSASRAYPRVRRSLLDAESRDPRARAALELYVRRIVREIGALDGRARRARHAGIHGRRRRAQLDPPRAASRARSAGSASSSTTKRTPTTRRRSRARPAACTSRSSPPTKNGSRRLSLARASPSTQGFPMSLNSESLYPSRRTLRREDPQRRDARHVRRPLRPPDRQRARVQLRARTARIASHPTSKTVETKSMTEDCYGHRLLARERRRDRSRDGCALQSCAGSRSSSPASSRACCTGMFPCAARTIHARSRGCMTCSSCICCSATNRRAISVRRWSRRWRTIVGRPPAPSPSWGSGRRCKPWTHLSSASRRASSAP